MPRLQGKPSSAGTYVTVLLILVAIAVLLEYFGAVDFVPNFGSVR